MIWNVVESCSSNKEEQRNEDKQIKLLKNFFNIEPSEVKLHRVEKPLSSRNC